MEDLPLPDLESFRLEAEETISRVPEAADAVELVAASENRPVGSASSTVLGPVRQRSFSFIPRAIFTFLQAPAIYPYADRIGTLTRVFPGTNEEKSEKGKTNKGFIRGVWAMGDWSLISPLEEERSRTNRRKGWSKSERPPPSARSATWFYSSSPPRRHFRFRSWLKRRRNLLERERDGDVNEEGMWGGAAGGGE